MSALVAFGFIKPITICAANTKFICSLIVLSRERHRGRKPSKGKRIGRSLLPVGSIPEAPLTWKKPEKVPFTHSWQTGDWTHIHPPIDMTKRPTLVENSKELVTANDAVKKLFTFDFLGRAHAMKYIQEEMVKSVRNHEYDEDSTEVKVALYTSIIRNLVEHVETNEKPGGPAKHYLNMLIRRRKQKLTFLRKTDYKRFEWILEKFNLFYTPTPESIPWITRKNSIRLLTQQYIEDYKANKLAEFKCKLESQKEDFLREKIESLLWIRKEEIECGIQPTVSEDDIEVARKTLDEHQQVLKSRQVVVDKSANILQDA